MEIMCTFNFNESISDLFRDRITDQPVLKSNYLDILRICKGKKNIETNNIAQLSNANLSEQDGYQRMKIVNALNKLFR